MLPAHGRRLLLAATTVALTAGLSTGVAAADAPGSSSWVDSKRAISDIASCKYHPSLPWCRKR
ncbi:hypothetical protein [Corynebacterium kalidii]|jgi:hypothetical protein|uniref:Secreted protein n=1 Tax=Corynebacterium kalidii TaxID=2931982 RepID=A0A9X2AXL9_9CORY|nr:hypothetical protein [Corynebacterium kalidii]MCJ7857216.1 hypothetical protein [Corynebacterium kalidii]